MWNKGNIFVLLFRFKESGIFLLHACIICLKDEISICSTSVLKTRRDELMKKLGVRICWGRKKWSDEWFQYVDRCAFIRITRIRKGRRRISMTKYFISNPNLIESISFDLILKFLSKVKKNIPRRIKLSHRRKYVRGWFVKISIGKEKKNVENLIFLIIFTFWLARKK